MTELVIVGRQQHDRLGQIAGHIRPSHAKPGAKRDLHRTRHRHRRQGIGHRPDTGLMGIALQPKQIRGDIHAHTRAVYSGHGRNSAHRGHRQHLHIRSAPSAHRQHKITLNQHLASAGLYRRHRSTQKADQHRILHTVRPKPTAQTQMGLELLDRQGRIGHRGLFDQHHGTSP